MAENADPLLHATEYLRDLDHKEDIQRAQTAADLERFREQSIDTLASANGTPRTAAEFAGQMAEPHAGPESVNTPLGECGAGYIARTRT